MSAPAITQESKLEDFPKNLTVRDYFKAAIGDKVEDILARMEVAKIWGYYSSIIKNIKINLDLKDKKSLSAQEHQKIIDELIRLFEASDSEIDKFNEFARRTSSNKDPHKSLDKILAEVMEVEEKEYTGKECFAEAFKGVKDGPFDHEAGEPRILGNYMYDILSVLKKELGIKKIAGQENHDLVIARLQNLYVNLESSVDELSKFAIFLKYSIRNKEEFSLDQLIDEFGKTKEVEVEKKYCARDCFVAAFEGVENGRHDDKIKEDKVYASFVIRAIKAKLNIKKDYIGSEEYDKIVTELKILYERLGSNFDKLVAFSLKVKRKPNLVTNEEEYDSCVKRVAESSWEERCPAHRYFSEVFGKDKVKAEGQSITITEGDKNRDIHSIKLSSSCYTVLISKIKAELSITGVGYDKRIAEKLRAIRSQCKTLEEFSDLCTEVRRQYEAELEKKPPLSSKDPLPPEKKAKRARSGRPKLASPTALSAPISNGQSHPLAESDSLEVAPSGNPCPTVVTSPSSPEDLSYLGYGYPSSPAEGVNQAWFSGSRLDSPTALPSPSDNPCPTVFTPAPSPGYGYLSSPAEGVNQAWFSGSRLDSPTALPSQSYNPCPSTPSPKPSFAGGFNNDFDNVNLDDLGSLFDHRGLTACSPIESPTSDDDGKRSSPSSSFSAEECERLARRARTGAYYSFY